MSGIKFDSVQLVLMMLTEQSFDKPLLQEKLYESFPELQGAKFQSVFDVPDPSVAKVAINSEKLWVNISLNRYSFNFIELNHLNLKSEIKANVTRINELLKEFATGFYRLGVVLSGKFAHEDDFRRTMSEMDTIKIDNSWEEVQFNTRKLHEVKCQSVDGAESLDIKVNVWRRFGFLFDESKSSVLLDVNTHGKTSLDVLKMPPEYVYQKALQKIVEELIDASV